MVRAGEEGGELSNSLIVVSDQMERMYDPSAERLGRDSGTDWMMFGYYIMNNISIAMRTFASGLLAGLGTLLVLGGVFLVGVRKA